jgi:hypothetical protein
LFSIKGFCQSRIKAKQYANEYGQYLMSKYGTSSGKNCTTDIDDIEIEENGFVMELNTSWDDKWGAIFKDDIKCNIKGVLTINFDGNNKKFKESFRNDAFNKIAKGKENDRLLTEGAKIIFSNKNSNNSNNNNANVETPTRLKQDGYSRDFLLSLSKCIEAKNYSEVRKSLLLKNGKLAFRDGFCRNLLESTEQILSATDYEIQYIFKCIKIENIDKCLVQSGTIAATVDYEANEKLYKTSIPGFILEDIKHYRWFNQKKEYRLSCVKYQSKWYLIEGDID